jgi:tetratricopeptide (TPR) repeat protein
MRLEYVIGSVLLYLAVACGSKAKYSPADYEARADSLVKKGEFHLAIAALEEANEAYASDTATVIKHWNACADIWAQHLNNFEKAIEYLEKVIRLNPASEQAPLALFKIAFTYETLVNDLDRAKNKYEEFLATYPDHPLGNDVKISLQHLGESDDELLERLLKEAEKNGKTTR